LRARKPTEEGGPAAISENCRAFEELKPHGKPVRYFAGFAIAAAVIVLTDPRLARVADQFADLSGLGGSFVGTTFVALSTSLPELVASIAAIRLGAFDLVNGQRFRKQPLQYDVVSAAGPGVSGFVVFRR